MKKSSYHNALQKWISEGLLLSYEVSYKKIATSYDRKTKTYKGPKTLEKVLILNFVFEKTFFVREQHIEEYLEFIEKSSK